MAKKAAKQEANERKEPARVIGADPNEPKLTAALLRRLLWVNTTRKALESKARQIKAEEEQLRDVVFSWLEERELQTVKRHGIRVSQKLGNAHPQWKEHFIREVGADAAARIADAAPRSVQLQIAEE
ncbi:hypothetical protein [Allorhodopirellula heiligendammensis]|uniref:Uncharacterized protein n=1 Tax=Allorhodopirellula heiligendammensis TaxID=2714739 RepID=A0A5C6C803_9BACT|nr:hypothetical protein [Allorhodopirellula heiligendammensis]TWU19556.1 hypothetical protein Poly21_17300 [Allorhodopirellula heiligendammensis]